MLDKLETYRDAAEIGVLDAALLAGRERGQGPVAQGRVRLPLDDQAAATRTSSRRSMRASTSSPATSTSCSPHIGWSQAHGVEVMLLEVIPGPDDLLCSYYTYLDDDGEPQFHFTKRVIRRYPEHEGFGCYHVTDWNPEVRDLGLRLFRHAGLKGIANVEFKRDPRDGELKLIECNARFTAANGLLLASGYDLGLFVYNRLAGRPGPALGDIEYRKGLRLWFPLDDFLAFLDLRRQGRLTFVGWLKSILHPQVLPYFVWEDPRPSLVRLKEKLRTMAATNLHRLTGRETSAESGPTRF